MKSRFCSPDLVSMQQSFYFVQLVMLFDVQIFCLVPDLERCDLLVLVSGDGDELCRREWQREPLLPGALLPGQLHNVDPGLVLVQAVQHDLTLARALVCQLHLGEAYGLLGPVATVVRRVWMLVNWIAWRGLRLATWKRKRKRSFLITFVSNIRYSSPAYNKLLILIYTSTLGTCSSVIIVQAFSIKFLDGSKVK